jgi:hypothetical protein
MDRCREGRSDPESDGPAVPARYSNRTGREAEEDVMAYSPPMEKYSCSYCGTSGVKLWRAIHSGEEAWCARCATRQAGLPDDIDDDGRRFSMGQKSDQVYSPELGLNLLPYVPTPDGSGTWGYSSVPEAGVWWWRNLPTRLTAAGTTPPRTPPALSR